MTKKSKMGGRRVTREICTCRWSPVNSTTIDPPHLIRDEWCPIHGRDPDEERERRRDDAEWWDKY